MLTIARDSYFYRDYNVQRDVVEDIEINFRMICFFITVDTL